MDYKYLKIKLRVEHQNRVDNIVLTDLSKDLLETIDKINVAAKLDNHYNSNDEYIQDIMYVPWIFCKIHYEQTKRNYSWSGYDKFQRLARRLYEFLIHVWLTKKECLHEQYLKYDHNKYNDYIDYYIKNITDLGSYGFDIKSNEKSNGKNTVKFTDSLCNEIIAYSGLPSIPSYKHEVSMEKYFNIDTYTSRIYFNDDSENVIMGRNPQGSWGRRIEYNKEYIDLDALYIKNNPPQTDSIEAQLESESQGRYIISPLIDSNSVKLLGFKPKFENSAYKRLKISNAISNNISKLNQRLLTDYNIPDINIFACFLEEVIIRESNLFSNIILGSFLLGLPYEVLIKSLMGFDVGTKINTSKSIMSFELDKNIFAKSSAFEFVYPSLTTQIIKTTIPQNLNGLIREIEQQLIDYINNSLIIDKVINTILDDFKQKRTVKFVLDGREACIFEKKFVTYIYQETKVKSEQEIRKYLNETDSMELFFKLLKKDVKKHLDSSIGKYRKIIKFSLERLVEIHYRYRLVLKNENDTGMLFFKKLLKSEEIKMCYCSVPAEYHLQKSWFLELQDALEITELLNKRFNISQQISIHQENDKHVGSPYFVLPEKSKNFFIQLENQYKRAKSELQADTLLMIYIRYALSLLLGTRDFHKSCDLSNYSSRFQLLTIQEKNKDEQSSKRMIPLCKNAIQLIEKFYEIKKKYGLKEFEPVLMTESAHGIIITEEMTSKSILAWFKKNNTIKVDENFVKKIPLRFGRHVITSYAMQCGIRGEYLDALLNHFKMGTEDQGRYSNYSNPEYINSIKIFLNDLAEKYLPKYGAAFSS